MIHLREGSDSQNDFFDIVNHLLSESSLQEVTTGKTGQDIMFEDFTDTLN